MLQCSLIVMSAQSRSQTAFSFLTEGRCESTKPCGRGWEFLRRNNNRKRYLVHEVEADISTKHIIIYTAFKENLRHKT